MRVTHTTRAGLGDVPRDSTRICRSVSVVRWNPVLGVIFVAIITFKPEGLVPGSVRIWGFAWRRWRALRPAGKPGPGKPSPGEPP